MSMPLSVGCTVRGDCRALGGFFTGRVEETELDVSDLHPDDVAALAGRVLVHIDGQVPPKWWLDREMLEVVSS